MLAEPKWITPNLIIQGHVILIPAPPNGGKTTIFNYLAGEMAKQYQVCYVNADISGGDAKRFLQYAEQHGFTMLLPDMKVGHSMDDVVRQIEHMNQVNSDYSNIVFIFDTLKKMTDVINKSKAKELLKTLRGLSAKGMTIILLAHTNKYNDADGNPIYEGTGDLRSDVDELIYLVPQKNNDGGMTVSTKPDKVRGTFEPITFQISANREVSLSSKFIDVSSKKKAEMQQEKDALAIEAITKSLSEGKIKQTEIAAYCKEKFSIGWRTIDAVLKRYSQSPCVLWNRQKSFQNNSWQYFLVEKHSPETSGKCENW